MTSQAGVKRPSGRGHSAGASACTDHPASRHTGRGRLLRITGVETEAQKARGLREAWCPVLGRAGQHLGELRFCTCWAVGQATPPCRGGQTGSRREAAGKTAVGNHSVGTGGQSRAPPPPAHQALCSGKLLGEGASGRPQLGSDHSKGFSPGGPAGRCGRGKGVGLGRSRTGFGATWGRTHLPGAQSPSSGKPSLTLGLGQAPRALPRRLLTCASVLSVSVTRPCGGFLGRPYEAETGSLTGLEAEV